MSLRSNSFKFIYFLFIFFIINKNSYSSSNFEYFNYIKNLKSFTTTFTQNIYKADGEILSKSSGRLTYKKKSKYILEYENPNKIKFISDSQFITTYDEDLEQVIIQSYDGKFKKNIIDIMTNQKLIKKKFDLKTYVINSENHIKFIPLDSNIENNIFLLVINDNNIKEITFMNDFDQSVIMSFSNFKKNIRILDSSFKIDIPENFDVIVDK